MNKKIKTVKKPNGTKPFVSGSLEYLSKKLIVIQKKKDKSKRKVEYMFWHIKEKKLIEVMQFISDLLANDR